MDFEFSAEEQEIKDQARRFLTGRNLRPAVRDLLDGKENPAVLQLWHDVAELGWLGAAIPEQDGGIGMGSVALCAIAEEVGRACAPVPMAASIYLAAEAIRLFGSPGQKEKWLPGLASGELVGTAVLHPRLPELAFADGRVTGVLGLVPSGHLASVVVAIAREADGTDSVVVVDCAASAIERRRVRTIDDSLPQAEMVFRGCSAERLGARGEGAAVSQRVLCGAAVLVAFEQIGGADACFEMARAYAMERRTFGRIVASYQAIKHKLVDIYVKNEIARSNAYFAAWALSEDGPELAAAAAAARLSATEAFEFASAENIQIHGGMGFTWEADPHLYYRRSRSLALGLEPVAVWQRRLMQALKGRQEILF